MMHSYSFRLWFWLIVKAFALLAVILFSGIGLGPDEAQYWTWSQALDWGYYSKPPGIAWQIWLGAQAFGQTEWGVRSLSVLLALFQARVVYCLALRSGLSSFTAFWSGLLMAFSPLGILGSFLAITDGGFLLCWTGACLAVVAAIQQENAPNPSYVGGWILLGALFKWPIYFFWFFYFCCCYWYFPKQRKLSILGGVLISLIGVLPSVWWNAAHGWATFRHVSATLQGGSVHQAVGNFIPWIGSQAALVSPILFVLLILALWQWGRRCHQLSPALFFCGFVTMTLLGSMGIASLFQKIQGNWVIFAYPTGFVLLAWYAFEAIPSRAGWAKAGLGLSIAMMASLFIFTSFYTFSALSHYAIGYRLNPLKHNLGWNALQEALTHAGYRPEKNFLVSDKYQTASLLSFYGAGQQRAYFLHLQKGRRNQFDYWPSLFEEQKGKTGFFVWVENIPYLEKQWKEKLDFYQQNLRYHFKKVEFVALVPLVYEGATVAKAAMIFRCAECFPIQPVSSVYY